MDATTRSEAMTRSEATAGESVLIHRRDSASAKKGNGDRNE